MVFIAVVLATPLAWWIMNRWLQDFAFRIDIEWWMFAAVGATALAIALGTVSWHVWRAARANPVEALRAE
jgi:putative ABC transport system permease protein